jgi:hypothetical protein
VDAYARFFAPASLLRRKLVLLLALWECEPQSDDWLQPARPVSSVAVGMRIALRVAGCALMAAAGWMLLTPLKLVTGREAAHELPSESGG